MLQCKWASSLGLSDAGWMALLLNEEKTDSFVAVHNATLQLLKVADALDLHGRVCARAYARVPLHDAQHACATECVTPLSDPVWLRQDERLDVLPNGSHLAFGNYGEASRPLKRVLKQVGHPPLHCKTHTLCRLGI